MCFRSCCHRCGRAAQTFRCWWHILSRFLAAGCVSKSNTFSGNDVCAQLVPVARQHSRAAEFDRAERNPHLGERLQPPLAGLKGAAEDKSLGAITLKDAERDHILKTLEHTRWVVAGPNGAAARLGIKRSTLYFRMQKLGISRPTANFDPAQRTSQSAPAEILVIDTVHPLFCGAGS